MKQFLFLLFLSLPFTFVSAQNASADIPLVRTKSIFDHLYVNQSQSVRDLVGLSMQGENVVMEDNHMYLKIQGFRTQVFSGNNQRTSKGEAFKKEKEVKKNFPDLPTYVSYNAPFWKLRVGDFRSHEEAYNTMRQLKKVFPSFGKEMYIVKEKIRIPLN